MITLLLSLAITILIEFIVYCIAIKKEYKKLFLYAILINAFTWPLAHLFYTSSVGQILVIEFLVFLVEIPLIALLFRIKYWKAIIISLIANVLTTLIGFVFMFLGIFIS